MTLKPFKIRCSAVGQIMTEPKTKPAKESGELSETSKTYCENWVKSQLYGREKEIYSREMDKGVQVEYESINFIADFYGFGMLIKNEDRFEDEFSTGIPDVLTSELVIDVKNSWDCFTFPLFETEINTAYYYQLQRYMHLTGRKKAWLIYTLMNTPEELLHEDSNWDSHNFDNVPKELRIKKFEIDYNEEINKRIELQVLKCRNYIEKLTLS